MLVLLTVGCECQRPGAGSACPDLPLGEWTEGAFDVEERRTLQLPAGAEGAARTEIEGVWDCYRADLAEGADYRLDVSMSGQATLVAVDPSGRDMQELVFGDHDEAIGGDERMQEDYRSLPALGLHDGPHTVLVFFLGPPAETIPYRVRLRAR